MTNVPGGLSTHVETSDKGSRRFQMFNDNRISEIEDEEDGSRDTTSQGAPHILDNEKCMSENMKESTMLHNMRKIVRT